jgi:cation-transporting P-type ATPase I
MSSAAYAELRVLSAVPGRIRVHLEGWSGESARSVEAQVRRIAGVQSAQARSITRNMLVHYDCHEIGEQEILSAIGAIDPNGAAAVTPEPTARRPHAIVHRGEDRHRARITVRGLDRDPSVAHRVAQRLEQRPGVVRVSTSPLTGRVLVECDHREVDLDDLLEDVCDIELPEEPGEDQPEHPLDLGPLLQSSVRSLGAGLGFALMGARQVSGFDVSPGVRSNGVRFVTAMGILQSFPVIRHGIRRLLGRHTADLLVFTSTIVGLTLAGSSLGLALTGAEAVRLLTEIVPRRKAWRDYEQRLESVSEATPDAVCRVDTGERVPLAATVIEGAGTATGRNGLPSAVAPGQEISAGSRLYGGPFVVQLQEGPTFVPQPRPAPIASSLYTRYINALSWGSLAYAGLTGLVTRSIGRAMAALLLVNPRTAIIGMEAADTGASARVLRSGVTIVGTRPDRSIRLPNALLFEGARALTDGFELSSIVPLSHSRDNNEIAAVATSIAAATGLPWGTAVFPTSGTVEAADASFDGWTAGASLEGTRYTLGPMNGKDAIPAALRKRFRSEHVLVLRSEHEPRPLALLALRPRLAHGVRELLQICARHGVEVAAVPSDGSPAEQALAQRAGVELLHDDALAAIRSRQETGAIVAFVSDSADAGAAFAACDLAVGLTPGPHGHFPARADLLAPDVACITAIVEAGARRELAVRDSVIFSAAANIFGAVWGLRGVPGLERASHAVYVTALAAITGGWARLRGGQPSRSSIARLVDPRPEQWGRRDIASVLRSLKATAGGLTTAEAMERRRREPGRPRRNEFIAALMAQLRTPLVGILAAGAGLSLFLGAIADVAMIGLTIVGNAAFGAWQERKAGQAVEAMERIGSTSARVLRDGQPVTVRAEEIVPGDVLVLASGDQVPADARIISAGHLEVDEAALTGESVPVLKTAEGGTDAGRIVLAGSDVIVGTGHAVVVAVGSRTRLGAIAAALDIDEARHSPLGMRLSRMLRLVVPLAGVGGLIVFGSGLLHGLSLLPQLAIGASIAVAAVPEGLPLLAGVGEAGVARRLARRGALVRRLGAVEALGRVDVACTDKTGTLTEGRLALSLVATMDGESAPDRTLTDDLRAVLRAAGIATPHPEATDAGAHATDMVIIQGAEQAGLGEALRIERDFESPFDPSRAFHAAQVNGHLYVKGAVEVLLPRSTHVMRSGQERKLDASTRRAILARIDKLAEAGIRVLIVARGTGNGETKDPQGLTVLGFVGISDPVRPGLKAAVHRCREAGVRVVMITGDHPGTARAVAREAGLLEQGGEILTGADITELENGELDLRLENAVVIARVTPLDKLRIVESLQRRGHTVAMTGDGVNDGPALRLADVGVAMGHGGTEVARQAADIVIADDDFSTLVEALVEGRNFWRNIRRALGLLLGGNLGELGLMVGTSVLGSVTPLVTRQILAVNLISDVLPALAVAVQPPGNRHLSELAREGTAALDTPLRNEVIRRGFATAVPSLAGFLISLRSAGLPQARSVAFASIVTTQLAQTLDVGRSHATLTGSLFGAVVGSAGVVAAALTVPPLQSFLGLIAPTPLGWALIAGSSLAAVVLGRLLSLPRAIHAPALRDRSLQLVPQPARALAAIIP